MSLRPTLVGQMRPSLGKPCSPAADDSAEREEELIIGTRLIGWLRDGLLKAPSPIHGLGLFTASPVPVGSVVVLWEGWVLSREAAWAISKDTQVQVSDDLWMGQRTGEDSLSEYVNHSCTPNLGLLGTRTVLAARDIAGGEELTLDYCMLCTDCPWSMTCHCSTTQCRETITAYDWQLAQLQQRYAGRWPTFLENRIRARSPAVSHISATLDTQS